MDRRMTALEEQVAHLEKTLAELSEVAARQDGEVARLTRLVDMLMQREAEREADQAGTIPLADQKPPHY